MTVTLIYSEIMSGNFVYYIGFEKDIFPPGEYQYFEEQEED